MQQIARELLALAKGTPFDTPEFRNQIAYIAVRGDTMLAARVKDYLSLYALQKILHPEAFPGPAAVPQGDLALGRIVSNGQPADPVAISSSLLASGSAILAGATGSGKTCFLFSLLRQLATKANVPFLFFEPEGQGPFLVEMLGRERVGIIQYSDVPIVPFGIPGLEKGKGTPDEISLAVRSYLPRLATVFTRQWIGITGFYELLQVLIDEMHKAGIFHGSGQWVTWSQFMEAVRRKIASSKGNHRVADSLYSALNRLGGLLASLPGLDCKSSGLIDYVLRKPLIIQTNGLTSSARGFLFDLLQTQLSYRLEQDYQYQDNDKPRLVLVAEEANDLVKEDGSPAGAVLSSTYTSGRKRGLVAITSVQDVSYISRYVLGNASLRCIFRLPEPLSRQMLRGTIDMSEERDAALATLPCRQFVLSSPALGADPMLVEATEERWPSFPSRERIEEWCRATLAEIGFEKAEPVTVAAVSAGQPPAPAGAQTPAPVATEPSGPGLGIGPLRVLKDIAERPDTIPGRMKRLNIGAIEEADARAYLILHGLIEDCGRFGKGVKLFRLTAMGREVAEKRGLHVSRYKSGELHQHILDETTTKVCSALPGWTAKTKDIAIDGVQPDALLFGPDGWRVAVQVCHTNSPDNEAKALRTLCAHVDRALAVCTTKKKVGQVKKAVVALCGKQPDKVVIVDFPSFAKAAARDIGKLLEEDT